MVHLVAIPFSDLAGGARAVEALLAARGTRCSRSS